MCVSPPLPHPHSRSPPIHPRTRPPYHSLAPPPIHPTIPPPSSLSHSPSTTPPNPPPDTPHPLPGPFHRHWVRIRGPDRARHLLRQIPGTCVCVCVRACDEEGVGWLVGWLVGWFVDVILSASAATDTRHVCVMDAMDDEEGRVCSSHREVVLPPPCERAGPASTPHRRISPFFYLTHAHPNPPNPQNTHTHTYQKKHTYAHIRTHTYIIYICIRTHTHTHTQHRNPSSTP
jgi:hypothetical protein